MRIALPLCNQNGPFAWQKCLQIYNLFYLAVLNILSQPEKENFLSFPRLSLWGRPSWRGRRRRNSSGSLCLWKYLHFILPGGAFSPPPLPPLLRRVGNRGGGSFTYFWVYHNTLHHFALLLIEHRSSGDLILGKGTQCAASLGPRWPARCSDPPPLGADFTADFSLSQTAPLWYLSIVHAASLSPVAFAASNDCGLCASVRGTQSFWGSRCKVCSSGACRLELVMHFCLWVSTRVFLFPDTFCIMKSMRVKLLSCDSHIH